MRKPIDRNDDYVIDYMYDEDRYDYRGQTNQDSLYDPAGLIVLERYADYLDDLRDRLKEQKD